MNERKVYTKEEPMDTTPAYVVRTGKIENGKVVAFRDDLIRQAKDKGRLIMDRPWAVSPFTFWQEPPPRWWSALAPLTPGERTQVHADLEKERQARKPLPGPTTSMPL